jgi:BirA family biotin operon repressor/biotin-[acetyl-CoA-carboxylase] ligase
MHPIREARIRSVLEEIESLQLFNSVKWLDTIDSTNRFMKDSIKSGELSSPALVVASQQTSGVGRGNNKWFSPEGCLMFTIAMPIQLGEGLLPLNVGLTIARAIEPILRATPKIKWPNDLYVAERKVGGILIEVVTAKQPVAIVGVGLNCQVDFSAAPLDVKARATSLHEHALLKEPEEYSPVSVLLRVIREWSELEQDDEKNREQLLAAWPAYTMLDGRRVCIESAGEQIHGICNGITDTGAIQIIDTNAQRRNIIAGTILSFE